MPPMTTNRTPSRTRTRRIGSGSYTSVLADTPCVPDETMDRVRRRNGAAQAVARRETERLDELRAVDPGICASDDVELLVRGREDPLERAVPRILMTALDGRDHRLRDARALRKLALRQAHPPSRRQHEPPGLHIWKSIYQGGSAQPGTHLGEEIE